MSHDNGTFDYVYEYKDHLGNVRLSYADSNNDGSINPSTEIIEENNYYPFGLKHKGYNDVVSSNGNSVAQKKTYNGKELQDELGLNWHDYGGRNYDTALGRWMNIDPLAEKFYYDSPYVYTTNNPIYYIDPDGKEWVPGKDGEAITYSEDKNGNIVVSENATDDTKQIVKSINESGSSTAKQQFKNISDSEGKVNLVVNKTDTGSNGMTLYGYHQPHDSSGNALNWNVESQQFDGKADVFTNSDGNLTYKEATITVYEKKFSDNKLENGLIVRNTFGVVDFPSKSDMMAGTFAHEVFHNLDQMTIEAVIDRGNQVQNNYDVETPAYQLQGKVHQEIKKNRKN
jgi:RHS repeat-associated protein